MEYPPEVDNRIPEQQKHRSDINKIFELLERIDRRILSLEVDFNNIKATHKKLDECIEGNGKPGLKVCFVEMEKDFKVMQDKIKWMICGTCIGFAVMIFFPEATILKFRSILEVFNRMK